MSLGDRSRFSRLRSPKSATPQKVGLNGSPARRRRCDLDGQVGEVHPLAQIA